MDFSASGRLLLRACWVSVLLSFLIVASLVASAHNPSSPQSPPSPKKDYALIYGTVWGPDDRPAAGVPIKIRRAGDKKPKWELISNRSGEFAQRVPAGADDYVIQADIKMPKGKTKPEITVRIEDNERKDVGIHLTQAEPAGK